MKSMIIVESKAKVQSIGKIVGDDYELHYCLGHIYDLPEKDLGIDIKSNFKPKYVQVRGKSKLISELKSGGKNFDTIILATDPDREGESIAWHLARLFPNKNITRMRFNEITEKGIKDALSQLSDIDMRLVNAQQARRVLDRLVGYKISPLLWKFLKGGLSAGRVQSVAVRMICDRENEIKEFKPEEWWSLAGEFLKGDAAAMPVKAMFYGTKQGEIKIKNESDAKKYEAELRGLDYKVDSVATRNEKRRPQPPFITSTLQQDAARRLSFSASKTMTIAQQLYEGVALGGEGVVGLISYMRTDSPRVSTYAQDLALQFIREHFGKDYAPSKANVYTPKKKSKADVQDAHEAIRPTYVEKTPQEVKQYLSRDQFRLYELVWNRFVASQMNPAAFAVTSVNILGGEYIFRASGTVVLFDGFQKVYKTVKENNAENGDGDKNDEKEQKLPRLAENEPLNLNELDPKQHFTKPPPRFTEASLVKILEEKGIGRPSTYVPTIETIKKRGYVEMDKRAFTPTKWGFIVTELLSKNFSDIVDEEFTARMEENLDDVEQGKVEWQNVIGEFYENFVKALDKAETSMKYEEKTDVACKECNSPLMIKKGRYGLFLGCSRYPECSYTEPFDPISGKAAEAKPRAQPQPSNEVCSKCGSAMVIREGRYGKFLACSGYPKCRNIVPYIGNFACPKPGCDGKIVKKTTKRRKPIYGCSKYPECDFVSWYPPLEENCPKCDTFLIRVGSRGQTQKKCANQDCGHIIEDAPEEEAKQEQE